MQTVLHLEDSASLAELRDAATLERARHAALVCWDGHRASIPVLDASASREQVLTVERTLEQFDRERVAIEARLAHPVQTRAVPLAVLAHRHSWTSTSVLAGLVARGWDVLDVYGDAAAAVAALVASQPDLLLCSDRVLGGDGLELLARAAELSPATRLVVQLDEDGRLPEVRAAGAHLVLSHRMPGTQVVDVIDGLRA